MIQLLMIPAAEGEPFLAEMTEPVDWRAISEIIGGYFTVIEGDGWHAYLDEEGQSKGLPINLKATALLRAHGWRGTYALGPVVFFGAGEEGEEADVPPELARLVMSST